MTITADHRELASALDDLRKSWSVNKFVFTRDDLDGRRVGVECCYEAFVLSLVCTAAENVGARLTPVTHGGFFRLRGNHGVITTTKRTFSYVKARTKNGVHEIHTDTFVATRVPKGRGKRKVELEVDVLVTTKRAADTARGKPNSQLGCGTLRLTVEVKYRSKSSDVGMSIAKEVLGQWSQIGGKRCCGALVANHEPLENARTLLDGAGILRFKEVLPQKRYQGNRKKLVDDISAKLGKWL